jgi:glycosyltransferase involved in cell wall biosynthesis
MNKPLTIGLVTPGWPGHNTPNGIATAVWHMARGLIAAGHKPVILAIDSDGPAPEGIPVVKVIRRSWTLPQKIVGKFGWWDIAQDVFAESLADAVEAAHRAHGLDAVVIEETQGWAHAAIRRGTVPVVVFLHGPWILHKAIQSNGSTASDAQREAREARAMCAAAALISPSQNVLDAVEAHLDVGHIPRIVIPNAYAPAEPRRQLPETGPFLFVGRFDYHKGGDTVIEAFRLLHARRPEARMTFAGPDRGLRYPNGSTRSMTEALGALPEATRAAIAAPGRQTADQVAALRQNHPIAVIASRYENLNYTMLEAMAAGQAIVSTRVGGPAEVFEDGQTALLVPPDDPGALADALERLLEDPALIRRLGSAAAERLEADFNPERIARRTVAFLDPILAAAP